MKNVLASPKVAAAVGPYSQAIETGGLVFVSGQLPIDPATGELREGIEEQTKQSLTCISDILAEAGLTMKDVVKTTVLLQHMSDFGAMNAVYATFFEGAFPARVCFEVAALPKGALVEIEAIAAK
ncbi:MAG: reactive intermediate/imine deaminase [Erysipelotrichaceae bacterium]|nr:reactive intermediate/imine deaminase [Erysipelotrichaceae bacterium]